MNPVIVCSKRRPTTCSTIRALEEAGIDFRVTLEREDVESYVAAGLAKERIVVLGESNQGIAYARNSALSYMRGLDVEWTWMLDDDVKQWFTVVNKRVVKTPMRDVLEGAEKLFMREENVALAALEYQQIAWSSEKPIKFNGYCDVAVCAHLERTRFTQHRPYVNGKEDRDYAMQLIAAGYRTARVQTYAFGCPPLGSNAGGLDAFYAQRTNVERACQRMLEVWGSKVVSIVEKKNGMPDAKINWRALAG